jgi:hypothetical protein
MRTAQNAADDLRRFVRYVVPGLIYFLLILIYFLLSNWHDSIRLGWNLLSYNNISGSIILILGASSIGFIFSIFHHTLFNSLPPWLAFLHPTVNHNQMLVNAEARHFIRLDHQDGTEIPARRLTRGGSWRVVVAFWHENRERDIIRPAESRAEALVDLMHSTGAISVAAFMALITWAAMYYKIFYLMPSYYYWIMPIVVCIICRLNYGNTLDQYQGFVEMVLYDQIRLQSPQILTISDRDIQ